jgi:MFS superfamily sulfate permease-like transporter
MKDAPGAGSWLAALKYDVPASVVVFLVALPLCMAIAVGSGMPASAGLITGIIGGIVVGSIAGSPLQVSGPAAGLIALVAGILTTYAEPATRERLGIPDGVTAIAVLSVILMIAGGIQVAVGALGLARYCRAVTPAVIEALLAGIGLLIMAQQFHVLMDVRPASEGIPNLIHVPVSIGKLIANEAEANPNAAIVGAMTIAVIVAWGWLHKAMASARPGSVLGILAFVPGSLLGVIAACIVAQLMPWQPNTVIVPDNFSEAVTWPNLDAFQFAIKPETATEIWTSAALMAFIASAESLLCAAAVDKLHDGPRTNYNQELVAQGIGNMLCALLGGVPMTGVIARSGANLDAKAKSRMSALLHGVWMLLLVLLAPWLLSYVPMAALAGVLLCVGWKLLGIDVDFFKFKVDFKVIKKLWSASGFELGVYVLTVLSIVALGVKGVLIGVVLAFIKQIFYAVFPPLHIRVEQVAQQLTIIHLEGPATFGRVPQLAAELEKQPVVPEIQIDVSKVSSIDHACLEVLQDWAKQREDKGAVVKVDWDVLKARFQA